MIERVPIRSSFLCCCLPFFLPFCQAGETTIKLPQVKVSREVPGSFYADVAAIYAKYEFYAEAAKLYRQAISLERDKEKIAKYKIDLGQALEATGSENDKAQARRVWDELARDPNPVISAEAKLHIAATLLRTGDTKGALAGFEEIAIENPVEAFRRGAASQIEAILKQAGTKNQKIAEYLQRFAANPENEALLSLIINLQHDNPSAKVETLKAAVAAKAGKPELQERLGAALIEAGDIAEAEKVLSALAGNFPEYQQSANALLARAALKKNDSATAKKKILESAATMPDGYRKSLHLSREFLKLQLADAAEEQARAAISAADNEALKAAASMELADALFRQRKFTEAKSLLDPLAAQNAWQGLQARAQEILSQIGQSK
ncbi:MAG TPA: hypothetical protein VEK08_25965 [Planctomycetota bacterium]|nr:hypothetical protein [Planctomycetota bacterium]